MHTSFKTVFLIFVAVLFFVILLGFQIEAQSPATNPVHLPSDWSHRHLVFSKPANYAQAWNLQNEPRYIHQYVRQHTSAVLPLAASKRPPVAGEERVLESGQMEQLEESGDESGEGEAHKDWAVSLGAGAFMGASQFPAKYTFDVNAAPRCPTDYVVFMTSKAGSATSPSIVAFDNLYSTQPGPGGFCNGAGPSVKWAYNTNLPGDTTGITMTSPVLSLDGTKVAYVESRTNANGGSILHLLKFKPGNTIIIQGTIAAPASPDTVMLAGQAWNNTNCPALNSCVANIVFQGAQPATLSSPFYNYATDELYVGDDNGILHKFTGVFLGTPAEVVTGGWPITVHAGSVLTSPVFDPSTSKNIFLGDNSGRVSFVKEVGSSVGNCAAGAPPCLGSVSQPLTGSIVDSPVVDVSTQRILVIDGTETSANHGSMFQFDTALTTASKVVVRIGGNLNRATDILHAGTFEDAYFSTGPAAGHFYTCGKDPNFNNRPAIYQFSFNGAGVLQTTGIPTPLIALTNNSLAGDACSPVSEIKNGAVDRIFFSIAGNALAPNQGTAKGCTTGQGCVAMIVLGGTWPPVSTTAGIAAPFRPGANQSGAGGSSGIVVDNVGTGAQQSNIYYTYRVNSTAAVPCNGIQNAGCAVKATQSALQ